MVKDKNLIDYTVQHQDRSDFFHSSGYATAQNGDGIGVAAGGRADSFAARQRIEQNRQHIRGYHDSQIGNARWAGCEAKQYDKTTDLNKMQSFRNNSSGESSQSSAGSGLGVDGMSNRKIGGGYGRSTEDNLSLAKRSAKFSAGMSNSTVVGNGTRMSKPQTTLGNAKAPIIPSRRSGI